MRSLMKTIYIVRHAKSSWDKIDLPDEKRHLMEKGRIRTQRVVNYLLEKQLGVDYIISSHAVRAHETAKILAQGLKYPVENIKIDPQLYHAEGDSIRDQIFELPDRFNSVMIVGHNPSLTDLVNLFMPSPIDNLPTSGVASFSFDADSWEKAQNLVPKTNFILFPKELTGKDE
jgi:phosphohistidine phosphatase